MHIAGFSLHHALAGGVMFTSDITQYDMQSVYMSGNAFRHLQTRPESVVMILTCQQAVPR